MATIANSRMTIGSIFAMVQTTASTVTNTLNAVNEGVEMLNNMVSDAAERQTIRSDNDMAVYESVYVAGKALELDESRDSIRSYINKGPDQKSGYEAALNEIQAAVTARKAAKGRK